MNVDIQSEIERIHRWLRDHTPQRELLLQRGLIRQEIDDLAGPMEISLTEEAYTLYEWRNGVDDRQSLFPGYEFQPLAVGLRDLDALRHDEVVLPDYGSWLFIFEKQYTWGGYALFCDTKPRRTAPVDYDGMDALTDSLSDLMKMIADAFENGGFFAEDGELEQAYGFNGIGFDREECYRAALEQDWEQMSQAVLRIGFSVAAYHQNVDLALDRSLNMLRNPSSRVWSEPMMLRDFMINLNFSTEAAAHEVMSKLLQHSDWRIRWRAANLVGNSQSFERYGWARPLAGYFAGELNRTGLPGAYRTDLILAFGKTGDRRAIPYLRELTARRNMIGAVAAMCLQRVYQDST